MISQIDVARETSGIEGWGSGYFSIGDNGNVAVHPTAEEHRSIDLPEIVKQLNGQGISTPLILRFPQIIENQIHRLTKAFKEAIWEYSYAGGHKGVFPFKVNQRREFIDSVVSCGAKSDYGLEVGSKTEMLAALSYELPKDALLICNGFKDEAFVDLAFIAKAMGKNVLLVVEGPDELQMVINRMEDADSCPELGIRVKLYSRGSGKWAKSSGESSKFGLTTLELINSLKMLRDAQIESKLAMLHFHIGSQITEIKRIKNAIKEASRVYSKVCKMGYGPRYLNIGGGVGVDYDGSKTSYQSSANYTLQEFANDAVYQIGEVCQNEGVACPTIITESGRVIAAHHSVIISDIREVQGTEDLVPFENLQLNFKESDSNKALQELRYILSHISPKNYSEFYHDAVEYSEELFTLFNLGYINLEERAVGEQLFNRICRRALEFASSEKHLSSEFVQLQQRMVSKYLANFSIFQSIPDSWSIDQLFPILPISLHQERPSRKAVIVDITCDSDGCLENFIDRRDVKNTIHLHRPTGKPYFLGFFLVGAYQESLANEHNLFGAINEAEVVMTDEGKWKITKITGGDPVDELLVCRNYDIESIRSNYRQQMNRMTESGRIPLDTSEAMLHKLDNYLGSLPYLSQSILG